jgi:cytoskeletal protein RodZ
LEKKTGNKKIETKKNKPKKTESKKINSIESEPKTSVKPKTLNKNFRLIIPLIVIICVIGLVWIFYISDSAKADEPKAQLVIESGTVQVKHAGESWTIAEDGMYLYESDSIKTGNNSIASIILFKSSVIRLENNTEVTIKELIHDAENKGVTIQQNAGRTWSTVSQASGMENYNVETPTAVASVRGTSFDYYILANGTIIISVGSGDVNITVLNEDGEVVHTLEVPETLSAIIEPYNLGEPPKAKSYTEDEWIRENLGKDEELYEDLKEELQKRIEPFLSDLRDLLDGEPSDEEINALIESYLLGDWDLPDDAPEWVKDLFEFT